MGVGAAMHLGLLLPLAVSEGRCMFLVFLVQGFME